jgi:hypothetical protein
MHKVERRDWVDSRHEHELRECLLSMIAIPIPDVLHSPPLICLSAQ